MKFSVIRITRLLIAITLGTAIGLYVLHQNEPPPPSMATTDDVGTSEVMTPDPAKSDLRLRITVNGRQGFVDGNGKVVIAPNFSMAMPFSEGLAAVGERSDGGRVTTWRFINPQGAVAITQAYSGVRIGTFHEGLAPLFDSSHHVGFIDSTGRVVVQPTYDEVGDFGEGVAAVRMGSEWGLIDHHGRTVLPLTYDFIGTFVNHRAIVAVDGRFGYIDPAGRVVIPPIYDRADDFSEGLACVQNLVLGSASTFTSRYIDIHGQTKIGPLTFGGGPFREGLAVMHAAGSPFLIDTTGKVVLSLPGAGSIGNFADGRAAVLVNGQYGFIDHKGAVAILPQWQFVDDFHNGICKVGSNALHGYINTAGKYVWKLMVRS